MHILLLILGALIVAFTIIDALWTTLWVDGHAGPFTRRYTSLTRQLVWYATPRGSHRVMSVTGPLILVLTVTIWALLLWTGWVLVFSVDSQALTRASTGAPAVTADRIAFVGFTLTTMGTGDFAPGRGIWELITSVTALSGLFLLTLSVTYLLSVLEAVVAKRSFASQVLSVGRTAEDFVVHAWTGRDFDGVTIVIASITQQLNLVAEQHQAYPMLHYYHEQELLQSVSYGLAVFDEALMLFAFAVRAELRPSPAAVHAGRESVRAYLNTLKSAYISPTRVTPPPPDLDCLRRSGIPTVSDDDLLPVLRQHDERRRSLRGFLESEHRDWPFSRG